MTTRKKTKRHWPILLEGAAVIGLLAAVQLLNAKTIDSDELTRSVQSALAYLVARGSSFLADRG